MFGVFGDDNQPDVLGDNRLATCAGGTRPRFYAKPSRFEKQETFHIEVVTFKTALMC